MKSVCLKKRIFYLIISVLLAFVFLLCTAACGAEKEKYASGENGSPSKREEPFDAIKTDEASEAADIAMTAIVSGDKETMKELLSSKFGDRQKIEERSVDMVLPENVRNEYEVTYKIGETQKISNLGEVKAEVAKGGVIGEGDVTDAVRVTVELGVTDKDGKTTNKTRYMIFTNEKGIWKLYELT